MNPEPNQVQNEVQKLYRRHYGKLVSSLLYFSSDIELETAEDLVQDSFSAALSHWKKNGIPQNPMGWIFTVSKNNALNYLKKKLRSKAAKEEAEQNFFEHQFNDSAFNDHQLKLLFACSYPDFSPKIQVAITLKYVLNFKIEVIAKIFNMSVDGVDKLLSRAKLKIKQEKILQYEPHLEDLKKRVPIVHKIIYLIFNEGYKSSAGKDLLKKELCEEALLLNKGLLESLFANSSTAALQALMLFNAARLDARIGPAGELLALEEQSRSAWNKNLIALGRVYLRKSRGGEISEYHYEASIAYLHCSAKTFAETDWKTIYKLYEKLLLLKPNPFVELNYAIALYYSGQKEKAIMKLKTLQENPFLNQYYFLNAALGKINLMEGNRAKAKEYFLKTLEQASFEIEKEYIKKMIEKAENDV